jgi:hypothetical protein
MKLEESEPCKGEMSYMSRCTSEPAVYKSSFFVILSSAFFGVLCSACGSGITSAEFAICTFAGTSSVETVFAIVFGGVATVFGTVFGGVETAFGVGARTVFVKSVNRWNYGETVELQ